MRIERGATKQGTVDAKLTEDLMALVGHALTEPAVKAVLTRATLPIGKKIDEQAPSSASRTWEPSSRSAASASSGSTTSTSTPTA